MEPIPHTAASQPLARPACPDDLALATRLRANDPEAYAELYDRVRGRLFAFAFRRLRDAAEAEDVVQDVLLQLYRSIGGYEGRAPLVTWIFGIAHHELCHRFRRHRYESGVLEDEALSVPAGDPPVDEAIDAARTLRRCADALERNVSPVQRLIFELRYGRACSFEAIARETGRSPGAIRVGLLRSRRRVLDACASEVQQLLAS